MGQVWVVSLESVCQSHDSGLTHMPPNLFKSMERQNNMVHETMMQRLRSLSPTQNRFVPKTVDLNIWD